MEILDSQDFIVTYKLFEKDFCDKIVEVFEKSENKWKGKALKSDGTVGLDPVKESWDLTIDESEEWNGIYPEVHKRIQEAIQVYIQSTPALKDRKNLQSMGYKIQMYPKGEGQFKWHCDALGKKTIQRVCAVVVYLNDVDEGGETEFFHQQLKFKPQAGTAVIFPTAWTYMHCGHIPVSSDKLIISTFIEVNHAGSDSDY